jgi:uncharacterized protein (UPF0261 family)
VSAVLVIATLDTKGPEAGYIRDRLRALGYEALVLDIGILGEPLGIVPEFSNDDLARCGGTTIEALRNAGTRGRAVASMRHCVQTQVRSLLDQGRVAGAIGLGGAEGAVMAASALQTLPLGVPKIVLSPIASGRHEFDPLVGTSDMMVMHTVTDILGLNPIATTVFDNAVAAMGGMLQHGHTLASLGTRGQQVAITMLGNTTTSAMAAKAKLEEHGFEGVIFHANGIGGPAMEELAEQGHFCAVLDLTVSELVGNLIGGVHVGGPERLRTGARLGIPQVIVPGCIDFAVYTPASIPEALRSRPLYDHNPEYTLVRTNAEESEELGRRLGELVSAATGPVRVIIPLGGLSIPNVPGKVFHDPEADRRMSESLRGSLRPDIEVEFHPGHVNDPDFGTFAAEAMLALIKQSQRQTV